MWYPNSECRLREHKVRRGGNRYDDSWTAWIAWNRDIKSLCEFQQRVKRTGTWGRRMWYPSGVSTGSWPDPSQQGISQAEAEDTGVFTAYGRSLSDETYPYAGGVTECKNDCQGTQIEWRSGRSDCTWTWSWSYAVWTCRRAGFEWSMWIGVQA